MLQRPIEAKQRKVRRPRGQNEVRGQRPRTIAPEVHLRRGMEDVVLDILLRGVVHPLLVLVVLIGLVVLLLLQESPALPRPRRGRQLISLPGAPSAALALLRHVRGAVAAAFVTGLRSAQGSGDVAEIGEHLHSLASGSFALRSLAGRRSHGARRRPRLPEVRRVEARGPRLLAARRPHGGGAPPRRRRRGQAGRPPRLSGLLGPLGDVHAVRAHLVHPPWSLRRFLKAQAALAHLVYPLRAAKPRWRLLLPVSDLVAAVVVMVSPP
mmetsp:Transcript_36182/g.104081  ORF Transcript_36182/g.104081 Transcript_36182/m.104081 type:complete len:267 (-) Transcript_36182:14-814(-)